MEYKEEKVEPIKLEEGMKVSELVESMEKAGFGARKIGRANKIIKKMFEDEKCNVFFGMAGAMVPAGMKQIVIDIIKRGKIDVFVTTGANLTHDLVEALKMNHYHCDIWNDEEMHEKGWDRIYNVMMKNEVYVKLEEFFEKNWDEISKVENIKDFLRKIGELLPEGNNSMLRSCYENEVDLYCPGIADSGIGLMIWGRISQGKKMKVDVFDDMKQIIDRAWTSEKSGVIYIGGGMPKNFIQQSMQFSKGSDYGVQLSIDRVEGGGSSGAPLEEGKSWGKLKEGKEEGNDFVDVFCDATIAMPLIFYDR